MTASARRWLSLEQAADLIGVGVTTVRRYIAEGRLTGYRVESRLVRVRADDVEGLLRPIPTVSWPPCPTCGRSGPPTPPGRRRSPTTHPPG